MPLTRANGHGGSDIGFLSRPGVLLQRQPRNHKLGKLEITSSAFGLGRLEKGRGPTRATIYMERGWAPVETNEAFRSATIPTFGPWDSVCRVSDDTSVCATKMGGVQQAGGFTSDMRGRKTRLNGTAPPNPWFDQCCFHGLRHGETIEARSLGAAGGYSSVSIPEEGKHV